MPIAKTSKKLIYFAHVPKCGGSSVQDYLHARFGALAFEDRAYLSVPETHQWTKTSPQHVDTKSLGRMFPAGFFDVTFTIVRHPVSRLISAYHFQQEVEGQIPQGQSFGAWLETVADLREENPFAFDNHTRPMSDIVPEGAHVFYLEHGLDALVPWLDLATGEKAGPRAIHKSNARGDHGGSTGQKVTPTADELSIVQELYAEDFTRFGYKVGEKNPAAAKPELTPEAIKERDAELNSLSTRAKKFGASLKRRLKT